MFRWLREAFGFGAAEEILPAPMAIVDKKAERTAFPGPALTPIPCELRAGEEVNFQDALLALANMSFRRATDIVHGRRVSTGGHAAIMPAIHVAGTAVQELEKKHAWVEHRVAEQSLDASDLQDLVHAAGAVIALSRNIEQLLLADSTEGVG